LRHGTVDGAAGGRGDPPQVGHPVQLAVSVRLAVGPRHHSSKTSAGSPRGGPGRHRTVANPRLAAPSKRARRQRATIVFDDESGLLLNPLVRRTLAPKGKTPTLIVRGRHRQKVSLIAGLTLSPRRSHRNL